MTSVIRFHLDEHVSSAIAQALRRRGIDVTTAVEVGLVGVDDHVQLAFAFQEARVMVTRDADFLRLHASGVPHAGIVYYPQTSRTVGQVIEDLILIYHVMSADEMPDRVIFL